MKSENEYKNYEKLIYEALLDTEDENETQTKQQMFLILYDYVEAAIEALNERNDKNEEYAKIIKDAVEGIKELNSN